jgi:RNA polymerase sigma-70 factor (ECF subfamily)
MKKKQVESINIDDEILESIKDKANCEPGERCIFTEIENFVKKALMMLPQNLRLSIVLREYEGLSYEDISKLTNTTIGTVKSRISRARLKLREFLADFI